MRGLDSHVSQDQLADMAALIPGAQLITIPAGHLVHAAQPARFISAVTAFLASPEGPARGGPAPGAPADSPT